MSLCRSCFVTMIIRYVLSAFRINNETSVKQSLKLDSDLFVSESYNVMKHGVPTAVE